MSLFAHELEDLVLQLQTQVQQLETRVAALESSQPANGGLKSDTSSSATDTEEPSEAQPEDSFTVEGSSV